jgi:hypothetical protein
MALLRSFLEYFVKTLQRSINYAVDKIWMDAMLLAVALYVPKKLEPNVQHFVVAVVATVALFLLQDILGRGVQPSSTEDMLLMLQRQKQAATVPRVSTSAL